MSCEDCATAEKNPRTVRFTALTFDEAQSILEYDAETGVLRWIGEAATTRKFRPVVSTVSWSGYLVLGWGGRQYKAHRVAWLLATGAWPDGVIDHINGDRADNRLVNLRVTDAFGNLQNQRGALSNSKSGLLGVYIQQGRWKARIRANGKDHWLGGYDTPEEAHAVYLAAKRRLHETCTI